MSITHPKYWLVCSFALSPFLLYFVGNHSASGLPPTEGKAVVDPSRYAGSEACVPCHEDQNATFQKSMHLIAFKRYGGERLEYSCEQCHGPGKEHVDSGGDIKKIHSFKQATATENSQQCLSCHAGNSAAHWRGSKHESADMSCVSCHSVHKPWTNDKALVSQSITNNCLSCHTDMKKHLFQRSSHPLREGQMSCTSCHNPHGSQAEKAVSALSANDKCYQCHTEYRGPFLWEHSPVRENCMTCHNPHGSNQAALLTVSAPRLCQSCHVMGHHQTVPGTSQQIWNINRSCLNCHMQIHGSNHPSGILFSR